MHPPLPGDKRAGFIGLAIGFVTIVVFVIAIVQLTNRMFAGHAPAAGHGSPPAAGAPAHGQPVAPGSAPPAANVPGVQTPTTPPTGAPQTPAPAAPPARH